MQLWTDKYKPQALTEIVAQHKAVGEVMDQLRQWKPGHKAIFIHGPAGTGKTLLVELIAKENKWFLSRLNASDSRSAKSLDTLLAPAVKEMPLFYKKSLILIDEVDGLSGRDMGATKSLIEIIKSSRNPIVLIANDPWEQKLKALRQYCVMVKFSRVPTPSIEKRLRDILHMEGITAYENVLKDMARFANGDLRSAIIDLQTISQGKKELVRKDLESLGFRERETEIFNVMYTVFHSSSRAAARKAIIDSDKDTDEVFWWIENNLYQEFTNPQHLVEAYDLMSKADVFRGLVRRQQNWRFKAYMTDLMAGVAAIEREHHHRDRKSVV